MQIYIGTYTGTKDGLTSEGIYSTTLDPATGKLNEPRSQIGRLKQTNWQRKKDVNLRHPDSPSLRKFAARTQ